MDHKQKPYITKLKDERDAYFNALKKMLDWITAEEKASNTAYKRDAERLAEVAKQEALKAIETAKRYGGQE